MNRLLLCFSLLLGSIKIFATAQIPDLLVYKGDTLMLYANPLELLPNIDSFRNKMFGRKVVGSTACWRGYQAEWTVINQELFLTAIYSCSDEDERPKADLKKLFGEKCKEGKVGADWVSAKIIAPQGKRLYYVHMGYESLYEFENEFQFKKGKLLQVIIYDNSKSRSSIYSQDSVLRKFIYSHINWEILHEDSIVAKIVVQFSANEQGVIDQIKVMRGHSQVYDQEAIRVVHSIPEWDVFYRRGKHERRAWNLPIHFSPENRKNYAQ
ncbi:hypothetical protein [Haliscomenobacter sp.]|uniref:hypothetical protein n=1 Tax=Haliscomenobacter sp. TaxID=2717303 RepID=UPI0035947B85